VEAIVDGDARHHRDHHHHGLRRSVRLRAEAVTLSLAASVPMFGFNY
jgi:hypothetical protein